MGSSEGVEVARQELRLEGEGGKTREADCVMWRLLMGWESEKATLCITRWTIKRSSSRAAPSSTPGHLPRRPVAANLICKQNRIRKKKRHCLWVVTLGATTLVLCTPHICIVVKTTPHKGTQVGADSSITMISATSLRERHEKHYGGSVQ